MRSNIQLLNALLWSSLTLILLLFVFAFYPHEDKVEPEYSYSGAVCGNAGFFPAHKSDLVSQGKTLFKDNCAACHNKDMKSDLTGPALRGFMKRWKNDTLLFKAYLKDPIFFLDTTSNSYILEMDKRFGPAVMNSFELSSEEVEALVEYIEVIYY